MRSGVALVVAHHLVDHRRQERDVVDLLVHRVAAAGAGVPGQLPAAEPGGALRVDGQEAGPVGQLAHAGLRHHREAMALRLGEDRVGRHKRNRGGLARTALGADRERIRSEAVRPAAAADASADGGGKSGRRASGDLHRHLRI